MSESKFISGLFVKEPPAAAPDFLKCKISMKREEVISWLQGQDGDWINVDIKRSKEGKLYAQVDDFKPSNTKARENKDEAESDGFPF